MDELVFELKLAQLETGTRPCIFVWWTNRPHAGWQSHLAPHPKPRDP
jgi:hypothetical protein